MQLRLQTAAHAMLECLKASAWYATIYVHTQTHTLTHTHAHTDAHYHALHSSHSAFLLHPSPYGCAYAWILSPLPAGQNLTGGVVFARSFGFDKQLWPQSQVNLPDDKNN